MKDTSKRTLKQAVGDVKLAVTIEHPSSTNVAPIIQKANQFLNWSIATDQIELDFNEHVVMNDVTIRVDKVRKGSKKVSLGFEAMCANEEDAQKLSAFSETGKRLIVKFLEAPKEMPPADEADDNNDGTGTAETVSLSRRRPGKDAAAGETEH